MSWDDKEHPCPKCGHQMSWTFVRVDYKNGQLLPENEQYEAYRCSRCSWLDRHIVEERVTSE